MQRGQIWWADLGDPQGSQPGYRRPVLIVQDAHFNQSRLATVIVLSLTSNLRYQEMPGNIFLSRQDSGLAKDSVINITQISTIDKTWLDEYVIELSWTIMSQVDEGLRLVFGL